MKESLAKLDKRLVLRETFTDENSVRANGGVPTNVVFEKSVAKFNSAAANNSIYYKGVNFNSIPIQNVSYRIKLRLTNSLSGILYIFSLCRTALGQTLTFAIRNDSLFRLMATTYGHIINKPLELNKDYEIVIVISNISTNTISYYINGVNYGTLTNSNDSTADREGLIIGSRRTSEALSMNGSVELFEIYEGTLTAQEVKNLYENKRYKQLMPHGEILGPELIVNGGFDTDTWWTKDNGTSIINGVGKFLNVQAGQGIYKNPGVIANRYYKCQYTLSGNNIKFTIKSGNTGIARTTAGTYTEYLSSTSSYLELTASIGVNDFQIDNVSVREVISNITPILDVDAFDGVIKNRRSGGLLPNSLAGSDFASSSGWVLGSGWSITNEQLIGSSATSDVSRALTVVAGKVYRVKFTVLTLTAGAFYMQVGGYSASSKTPTLGLIGTYVYDLTATSGSGFSITGMSGFTGTIDNISVQEIIPSVIPTAVQVVKDGGVNVMRFTNPAKLEFGNYNRLLGDITTSFWIKIDKFPSTYSCILTAIGYDLLITNSKNVHLNTTGYSSGSHSTAANSLQSKQGAYVNIVNTLKSNGLSTFYINGILSGSADVNTGTPIASNGILTIGAITNGYNIYGNLAQLQIYQGIMSQAEISQLYTSQKSKYNI